MMLFQEMVGAIALTTPLKPSPWFLEICQPFKHVLHLKIWNILRYSSFLGLEEHHDVSIIISFLAAITAPNLSVQHCDTLNGRSWREIGCQKIKACHLRDQPTSHHHSADEFSRYYWLDDHHNSSIHS